MTTLAERLHAEVEAALSAETLASSEPLAALASLAFKCVDTDDLSRRAVAYALFSFFRLEELERHEATFLTSEAADFSRKVASPIRDAVAFLKDGGPADRAISIIAGLSRI